MLGFPCSVMISGGWCAELPKKKGSVSSMGECGLDPKRGRWYLMTHVPEVAPADRYPSGEAGGRASAVWPSRSREVAPPPALLAALERLFGPGVRDVAVIEHSLFARLHLGAVATTRRRRIYLSGSAADFFAHPALLLHEYCHVLRQWEPGTLTAWRYVAECCRHGYYANRFEMEARQFTAAHVHDFAAQLGSPEARLVDARAARQGRTSGA